MNITPELSVAHKKLIGERKQPTGDLSPEILVFEPSPIPKQNLGELASGEKAEERKQTLYNQQQAILAKHRAKIVACDASGIRGIAGKLHIASWADFDVFFRHLAGMGSYDGLVVFGGWCHTGPVKLAAVPTEILNLMKAYRKTTQAAWYMNHSKTLAAKRQLALYLREHFPAWYELRIDDLRAEILKEQTRMSLELETSLLFLQTRIFSFPPTAKDSQSGWKDFLWFVESYRSMEKHFEYTYEDYFWGWFNRDKKPAADGSSMNHQIKAKPAPAAPRGVMEIN